MAGKPVCASSPPGASGEGRFPGRAFPRRSPGSPRRRLQLSGGKAIRPAASDVGVWLSLVEHLVRDEGVAGSNPATPTST